MLKSFITSQVFGIILGAILTAGFTWFIEWRKSVAEQKFHIREKREETYQNILRTYYEIAQENHRKEPDFLKNSPQLISKFYPIINIYASNKVKSLFDSAAKGKGKEKILIEQMRKELGIKD